MRKTAYRISFFNPRRGTRRFMGQGGRIGGDHPYALYTKRAAEEQLMNIGSDKELREFFTKPKIERIRL